MLVDSILPDEEGSDYEYEYDENETEVRFNLQDLIAIYHSAYLSHNHPNSCPADQKSHIDLLS